MNIKASVVLLLILTPVVLMSHINWSQEENGLLFNVDGRDVDFVGIVKDTWRTTTKRCDAVTELESADRSFKIIQTLVGLFQLIRHALALDIALVSISDITNLNA